MLSIALLHTADLTEGTPTNAEMELLSLAEKRAEDDHKKKGANKTVRFDAVMLLFTLIDYLVSILNSRPSSERNKAADQYRIDQIFQVKDNVSEMRDITKTISKSIQQKPEDVSIADMFKSPELDLEIDLGDAVTVGRNMQEAAQSRAQPYRFKNFKAS